jgi:hypothetical protein
MWVLIGRRPTNETNENNPPRVSLRSSAQADVQTRGGFFVLGVIMAGDWIKIEHGLLHKPEVMQICDQLDIGPHEAVGHLVAFWVWVDQNLSPICPQVPGTKKGLDRVVGRDGFTTALENVGWLTFADGVISVPNYDVHLSNSAKQRAKDSKKKAKQRSKHVPEMSPPSGDKIGTEWGTREEKRREEKKEDSKAVRPKFTPPTLDEVSQYVTENQYPVDAERFVDFYQANGWVQGKGKPIKDWKATVRTWSKNQSSFTSSQQPTESRYNLLTRD